jgi:hypothetical protein
MAEPGPTTDATTGEDAAYARDASGIEPILGELREQGYTADVTAVEGGALRCGACGAETPAAEVGAHELRRTEGASDPADMSALVAVTCPACGARGVLVAAFGPDASAAEADVLAALPVPERVNTVDRT